MGTSVPDPLSSAFQNRQSAESSRDLTCVPPRIRRPRSRHTRQFGKCCEWNILEKLRCNCSPTTAITASLGSQPPPNNPKANPRRNHARPPHPPHHPHPFPPPLRPPPLKQRSQESRRRHRLRPPRRRTHARQLEPARKSGRRHVHPRAREADHAAAARQNQRARSEAGEGSGDSERYGGSVWTCC